MTKDAKKPAPPEDAKPAKILPEAIKGRLSRSSKGMLLATILLAAVAGLTLLKQPSPEETNILRRAEFDLQGHRGARGHFPENTLEGFVATIGLGVTTLEMDAVVSADGVLVLSHDRRLNPALTRTPEGKWLEGEGRAIREFTWEELASYDIGRINPENSYSERFVSQEGRDGIRFARLDETLRHIEGLSGGQMRYNIEIKTSPLDPGASADPEAAAKLMVALLKELGLEARASVQSFDWRSLVVVEALAPEIATAFLTAEQSWLDNLQRGEDGVSPWLAGLDMDNGPLTPPEAIKHLGGSIWSPYYRDLLPFDLKEAQSSGLSVIVWTVNDPEAMRSLITLGVDGIITDYPDRLRRVLEEMGRPLPAKY